VFNLLRQCYHCSQRAKGTNDTVHQAKSVVKSFTHLYQKRGPDLRHVHSTLSNRSKILAMPWCRTPWLATKKLLKLFPVLLCPAGDAAQHLADRRPLERRTWLFFHRFGIQKRRACPYLNHTSSVEGSSSRNRTGEEKLGIFRVQAVWPSWAFSW